MVAILFKLSLQSSFHKISKSLAQAEIPLVKVNWTSAIVPGPLTFTTLSYTDDEVEVSKQEKLSRMLSLAIIPGHHISAIAIAKEKNDTDMVEPLTDHLVLSDAAATRSVQRENDQSDSQQNQHLSQHKGDQHESDQHDREQESEGNRDTIDVCTEEHGQTHENIHTPQENLTS